jgi:ABC-2 type transport system permease protein
MQFRSDFLVGIFSVITLNIFNLVAIWVVLSRFQSLAGWNFWQIGFLYCFWVLGHSMFSLFLGHISNLENYITLGTFDMFLIRPISPLVQLIGREINYFGFADVIIGVSGLLITGANLNLHFNWLMLVLLIIFAISSTWIEFSITLALASIAFWTGRSRSSVDTVMQTSLIVQRYPVNMLGQAFQIFVTCIVPVAFINYYPAKLLLGMTTPNSLEYYLGYLSPLVAFILVIIALRIWKIGLRQYSSSGG